VTGTGVASGSSVAEGSDVGVGAIVAVGTSVAVGSSVDAAAENIGKAKTAEIIIAKLRKIQKNRFIGFVFDFHFRSQRREQKNSFQFNSFFGIRYAAQMRISFPFGHMKQLYHLKSFLYRPNPPCFDINCMDSAVRPEAKPPHAIPKSIQVLLF